MPDKQDQFMNVQQGLLTSKAFVLFYFDESSNELKIYRDINRLNTLEMVGLAQLIDNYTAEVLSCFGVQDPKDLEGEGE